MRYLIVVTFFSSLLFSCSDPNSTTSSKAMLPVSMGAKGELFICMDSLQWKGPLGEKVREVFMAEMGGLPREEYIFTIRYVQPEKMTKSLRTVSNLVYVTTLDARGAGARVVKGYFTPEFKTKIQSSDDIFLSTRQDLYSRGQTVMYLFGNNETELIKNIDDNSTQLVDHFNKKIRERLSAGLFKNREKGLENTVKKEFDIELKIPNGYELAMIEENFIWLRSMDNEIDKSILIYHTPYYDVSQFEKFKLIEMRDQLGKKYIYEDKDLYPDSYMITETEVPFIPVTARQINLNGKYAVETRGLWKTSTSTMGGPFIGLAQVDEANNRFFYLEGFVFSPGEPQREIIREMETVLYTLKTPVKNPE